MRRLLFPLMLCILLLASCAQDISPVQGEASVSYEEGYIQFSTPKTLLADSDAVVSYYEYKAEPLFETLNGQPLRGTTDGYKKVGVRSGMSDLVGPFTQGRWRISVHACNAGGSVLYKDSKDLYIAESTVTYIVFNATRGDEDGYVDVNVTTTKTTDAAGLTVTFNDGSHSTVVTNWTIEDDGVSIRYTGTATLKPGSYIALFSTAGPGDAVSVEVLAGETSHITGNLDSAVFTSAELNIVNPEYARGHITASKTWIELGESITLTFVRDAGNFVASDVIWFVNGIRKGTGMSLTLTPESGGVYEIVAFVCQRLTGTNMGNTQSSPIVYESSTSASWTIKVSMPYTAVRITRAQIIDAPAIGNIYDSSDRVVTFPYNGKVLNTHADGRYTLLELGLHK